MKKLKTTEDAIANAFFLGAEELRQKLRMSELLRSSEEKLHVETRAKLEEIRSAMIRAKEQRNDAIDMLIWTLKVLPGFVQLATEDLQKTRAE